MQASHIHQRMDEYMICLNIFVFKKVLNSVPCIDILREGHINYEVI
jgi:hypothetical protein